MSKSDNFLLRKSSNGGTGSTLVFLMLEAKLELVPPKQRWNLFRHSKNLPFQAIRQTKFDQFAFKTKTIHFNPKSAVNMAGNHFENNFSS